MLKLNVYLYNGDQQNNSTSTVSFIEQITIKEKNTSDPLPGSLIKSNVEI